MSQERLNAVALMNVHKDIMQRIVIEDLLDDFKQILKNSNDKVDLKIFCEKEHFLVVQKSEIQELN